MSADPNRLPLNALRVFEAVATHLSFTAAAKELGVTTAAVSAQIKSLEADVGVPLFRRHTRAVALTQEGAELLPGVRRGLDELRRSVDRLRRERVGGMLNLSVPNEFLQRWLLPRLGEFTRLHPEIEVRFGPSRAALDFSRDDFHAAILYGSGNWEGLQVRAAARGMGVPRLQPRAAREARPDRHAERLRALPAHPQPDRTVGALAAAVGGDTSRAETVPMAEDSAATLTAVEQGKGVALARWSLVAADLAAGRLVRPMMPSVQQRNAWHLVAPPKHFSLPKVVRFRGWIVECCREFPPPTGEMLAAD